MIPIMISTENYIVEVSSDGIKVKERIWITETKDESSICKGSIAACTKTDTAAKET